MNYSVKRRLRRKAAKFTADQRVCESTIETNAQLAAEQQLGARHPVLFAEEEDAVKKSVCGRLATLDKPWPSAN